MYLRGKRKRKASVSIIVVSAALLALTIGIYALIERNILPVIVTMSEAKVQTIAMKAIGDAVKATMTDPEIFSNLVICVTDSDGTISMIQANTALINDLSTKISQAAQQNIADMGEQGIKIPLGSVMGSQLLSGRGPMITVRIVPIGTVRTHFTTEFENAGINQTRHKIIMQATATMRLVMPGNKSRSVEVTNEIPISEAVVIGKVPGSYVNVGDESDLTYPQSFFDGK